MTILVPFVEVTHINARAVFVRRVALVLLVALGIASIAVAAWSLAHGGIGWDSRFDTQAASANRSVDPSWSLSQAYEAVPGTSEFYGVFLHQFAAVLHAATTASSRELGPDDPTTYLYQGAANLILSVLSVTALAYALAVAFRSVLAAAFAWSLTLATPLWLGMSHVDFKDVPVAAGLTSVSAGLILCLSASSSPGKTFLGVTLAGAGGAVTLATRAGSLVLLAALVGGTLVFVGGTALVQRLRGRPTEIRVVPLLVATSCALLCALAFTWATNPIARIDMLPWLKDAMEIARNFPWVSTIRTAGKDLQSTDLPWWYVPAWVGAQLPVLTLAAVGGGIAVLVVKLWRSRTTVASTTAAPFVPILLQALVLPAVIAVTGAVLYDGIRHVLFLLPALLAIPAVAFAIVDRRAHDPRATLPVALPLIAVVVVATSLFASIRWAPYAYAFVNPVAGHDKDGRSWELDYWGVSGREGVTRLQKLGLTPVRVVPWHEVGIPWQRAPATHPPGQDTGVYAFLRNNPLTTVYAIVRADDDGCTVIFTIERDGHVLGEGARCPA